VVVKGESNDYDAMLSSFLEVSDELVSCSMGSSEKPDEDHNRSTVICLKKVKTEPDPNKATFIGQPPAEQQARHEDVGGPTLATEGDAYELDPADDFFTASQSKSIFTTSIGTVPTRIYCPTCRKAVMSAVDIGERSSFWQDLFAGFRCCSNPCKAQVIIHSC
jgi:hypothetical protein